MQSSSAPSARIRSRRTRSGCTSSSNTRHTGRMPRVMANAPSWCRAAGDARTRAGTGRSDVVAPHGDDLGDAALPPTRARCTTRWMASAMASRTLRCGSPTFAVRTQCASRVSACSAEFAWMVLRLPRWPVFRACSRSNASAPRTSPTRMRSGRCRSVARSEVRDRHGRQRRLLAERRLRTPRLEAAARLGLSR